MDSKYEEYKTTLLHDTWFRKKLRELYEGSIKVEKDYIDENGVLWKVGGLGAVCGFFIAFISVKNGNWILGIALLLGIIGCVILARHIGEKFKKNSGERKFYAFWYDKYFEDRIHEDRCREMSEFNQDFSKTVVFMKRCVNKPSQDPSEVVAEFQLALHYVEDLEKQLKELSEYDRYPRRLKNDYPFNLEIHKDIIK